MSLLLLALLVVSVGGAGRYLAWRDRRRARLAHAEAIVREAFDDLRRHLNEPTREHDLVDPGWDRSSREIHHLTVPEFQDVNAKFMGLIERNWPNQT